MRISTAVCSLFLLPCLAAAAEQPARPIELEVDASEIVRNLVHARLRIPVQAGPLTLFYPKWIPGNHRATGPIADLAGLKIKAGTATLDWRRDEEDPYTVHCRVPEGTDTLEVALDLLASPVGGPSSSTAGTPRLGVINWNQVLLYPKSPEPLRSLWKPALRLPEGWKLGTALAVAATAGDRTAFNPVSLETLVDSPVLCGRFLKEVPLGPDKEPRAFLVMACDGEAGLELKPDRKACYDRLIAEGRALFGATHYRSYRFLLALSDRFRGSGLEHHESSDNRLSENAMIDPILRRHSAGLLPHEYFHSWNGKYRRPADMIVSDYQQPHRTRLLWIYEGLTSYYTVVLTVRCGLWSPQEAREYLAGVAESMSNHKGRAWRSLEDTAVASSILFDAAPRWESWRRSVDFYPEGVLLWLEVDALIRQQTAGKKSLDDFCRAFFGGQSGPPRVLPYTLDELAAALNSVSPHDWKSHLERRVTAVSEQAPLDGLTLTGWKLAYGDKPSEMQTGRQKASKQLDLSSTLGFRLTHEGAVVDIVPGKPADKAGIGPGMKLIAVNGRRWSAERLTAAVAASKTGGKLELLLENGEFYRTHALEYRDGLRYPRLERIHPEKPELLEAILKSRT